MLKPQYQNSFNKLKVRKLNIMLERQSLVSKYYKIYLAPK